MQKVSRSKERGTPIKHLKESKMINKILFTLSFAFILLCLGVNNAYALRIEWDLPTGMGFGLKAATKPTNAENVNKAEGNWNVIPVRLIRDNSDPAGMLVISDASTIKCAGEATPRVASTGEFTLGSSPQWIEHAEWRKNYFLEEGVNVINALLYVKTNMGILFEDANANAVDTMNMTFRLPGSAKVVTLFAPATNPNVVMPKDTYTIKGVQVKAMVQVWAAPVSTGGGGDATQENDYSQEVVQGTPVITPANSWKPEDVVVSNPLKVTDDGLPSKTVTIPYSSDGKPDVTQSQSILYSCGYFNFVATPNINVRPQSSIEVWVSNIGSLTITGTARTKFILAERLLAFGNTYYKTTEGGAVSVDFLFTSALTKPLRLYTKQVDGTPIDIGDGIPATKAKIEVDYVGKKDQNGNDIVYNQSTDAIGENKPYVDLPAGVKGGRLLIQTLNNGVFALRRALIIKPGGDVESDAVSGGTTGETCIFIDEISQYPRTKIAWANPYAKEDALDADGNPIKVDMFNNLDVVPPELGLEYVTQSDTDYHGSVSKRTVPYNKGAVYIYAESDIANEVVMQIPVEVRLPNESIPTRNSLIFEVGDDGITKRHSNNVIEFFYLNAYTKDIVLKYISMESEQSVASSFGKTLQLTVRGKPSYATLKSITNQANTIDQGKSLKYRIELTDGPNSRIKGSRSQDLIFDIINIDSDYADFDKAILNVDYTLPTRVTIPAGKNYVNFEIKTNITPASFATERFKAFTFGVSATRAVTDSTIDPTSPLLTSTRRVIFKPKTAKPKTAIWTSSNKLYSEINGMTIFSLAMNTEANSVNDFTAKLSYPQKGKKGRFLLFSLNGVDSWTTELSNLKITKDNPVFIYVRALSTYSFNGNFTANILIEVGKLRKTVKIAYSDYRPYAFPDYSGLVPDANSELSLYPLHFSTKNATNYANTAEVDVAYRILPPAVYQIVSEGLSTTPTLTAVDSTSSINDFNGTSSLPKLILENIGIIDTGYGMVSFAYAVKNALGFVSTDSIYVNVGGALLKYSTGVYLTIEGQKLGDLPRDVKSVFAEYSDPVQKSDKVKNKKVAFKIKTEDGSRYAYLNKPIKLYTESMLKKTLKNGKNSINVPQKGAVELKIGYTIKGAAGTYKDKLRRYVVPPQDLTVKTWFDAEVAGNARGNPLHPGSIIKLTGRFLGTKPKITLESTENGVREAGQATCKILSIEPAAPNDRETGKTSMYIQLPTSLPRNWDYTAALANLVVNSGSGIATRSSLLFSAQFDGTHPLIDGDLDARPVCLENVTVAYINTSSVISKKSIDINVIGEKVDDSFADSDAGRPTKGFLVTDANSDKLQIINAAIDYNNSENIQGKISIIRDAKTGGEKIRFTRTGNVSTPGRVKIIYTVKEVYASKVYDRTSTGSFYIQYNP